MTDQKNVGLFYKIRSSSWTFLLCALRFTSWIFEEKKSKALGQEAQVPVYCIECVYINTLLYKKNHDENLSAHSKNVQPNDFIL